LVLLTLCTSLGLVSACSSSVNPADSAESALGRKDKIPPGKLGGTSTPTPTVTSTPAPTIPTTGSATYDASVGTGVDADGFAMLPLRSGAHHYFVNSASGADSNGCSNGQQPAKPLKTIAAAMACVAAGNGDQVLLAEGTSYAEALPWLSYKGGYNPQYPTVIASYDPADPLNEAKYGRGDQRGARPVLTGVGLVSGDPFSYLAIKGLDFNPGNVSGRGLEFRGDGTHGTGGGSYILLENNLFRYTTLSYSDGGDGTTTARSHHLIIRNNAIYGAWSDNGNNHIGGLYAEGNDAVTVEDNVFYHTGWRIGGSRDDNPSSAANGGSGLGGGPTIFNHPIYLQANADGIVRRNLMIDNAADAGIARGNILWTENVAIRNPAGFGLGPGNGVDYAARPTGNDIEASYNLSIEGINIASGGGNNDRGYGYTTANGRAGSKVHHNILIYSDVELTSQNAQAFSNIANANQPAYMAFENNVVFHWNRSGSTHFDGGGMYPAQVHSTYNYNIWDDPASGTNTNRSTASFPNPYTQSLLYSVGGYATLDALINYTIAHPEAHSQRALRALAFTAYGIQ
jgi:hypothetical protein